MICFDSMTAFLWCRTPKGESETRKQALLRRSCSLQPSSEKQTLWKLIRNHLSRNVCWPSQHLVLTDTTSLPLEAEISPFASVGAEQGQNKIFISCSSSVGSECHQCNETQVRNGAFYGTFGPDMEWIARRYVTPQKLHSVYPSSPSQC